MFYWSNSTDIAGQLFNRRNFFELRAVKIPLFYRLFSFEVNSEKTIKEETRMPMEEFELLQYAIKLSAK